MVEFCVRKPVVGRDDRATSSEVPSVTEIRFDADFRSLVNDRG